MRVTLIHSPGGGSASDEDLEQAKKRLAEHFELDVLRVSKEQAPPELAKQALKNGSKVLIASGGDGTVSAVGGVLAGQPDARLGILPRGTANSIATHLGVPRELEAACKVIIEGHTRAVDTALVNQRPMLLMATIGVHAEAITQVDPERKKQLGALSYVLEEVNRMLEDDLFEVTLEADGQRASMQANAVTVANMARVVNVLAQGGESVEADDGLLDVTVVAIRGLAEAVATTFHLATSALMERPAERDNVGHFRTREITISTNEPRRVMVDGEDACSTPIHVRLLPASLRVLVPRA